MEDIVLNGRATYEEWLEARQCANSRARPVDTTSRLIMLASGWIAFGFLLLILVRLCFPKAFVDAPSTCWLAGGVGLAFFSAGILCIVGCVPPLLRLKWRAEPAWNTTIHAEGITESIEGVTRFRPWCAFCGALQSNNLILLFSPQKDVLVIPKRLVGDAEKIAMLNALLCQKIVRAGELK